MYKKLWLLLVVGMGGQALVARANTPVQEQQQAEERAQEMIAEQNAALAAARQERERSTHAAQELLDLTSQANAANLTDQQRAQFAARAEEVANSLSRSNRTNIASTGHQLATLVRRLRGRINELRAPAMQPLVLPPPAAARGLLANFDQAQPAPARQPQNIQPQFAQPLFAGPRRSAFHAQGAQQPGQLPLIAPLHWPHMAQNPAPQHVPMQPFMQDDLGYESDATTNSTAFSVNSAELSSVGTEGSEDNHPMMD